MENTASSSAEINALASETTPLKAFQALIGITTPSELNFEGRPGPNIGLYKQIVKTEEQRLWQYYACSAFIDGCLMAQIAFAAILTALGASGSPYKVITVFGAVNTAIAGILALVKGRGLPARLRKDWVGLRQVRDYIEERERDLEQGVGIEDLPAEIKKVIKMYDDVRNAMENNEPDSYVLQGSSSKGPATTTKDVTTPRSYGAADRPSGAPLYS